MSLLLEEYIINLGVRIRKVLSLDFSDKICCTLRCSHGTKGIFHQIFYSHLKTCTWFLEGRNSDDISLKALLLQFKAIGFHSLFKLRTFTTIFYFKILKDLTVASKNIPSFSFWHRTNPFIKLSTFFSVFDLSLDHPLGDVSFPPILNCYQIRT